MALREDYRLGVQLIELLVSKNKACELGKKLKTLCAAMVHVSVSGSPPDQLDALQRHYLDAVRNALREESRKGRRGRDLSPEAAEVFDLVKAMTGTQTGSQLLQSTAFQSYLLKAVEEVQRGDRKEEKPMQEFQPQPGHQARHMTHEEMANTADKLAGQLREDNSVNENKLKRMAASVAAARDEYQALAFLAKSYAIGGVTKGVIDRLVEHLGSYSLQSVKDLIALVVLMYRASKTKGAR